MSKNTNLIAQEMPMRLNFRTRNKSTTKIYEEFNQPGQFRSFN